MHRPTLNFLIDLVAFVAFAFLTTTGILTRYLLPPGSGRWATLWGLNRHQWGDLHFWVAVVLLGVLAIHLVLHWRWILCIVKGKRPDTSGWRVGLGLVGLIGLLGLAAAPLLAPVEQTAVPRQVGGAMPEAQAPRSTQGGTAAPGGQGAQARRAEAVPNAGTQRPPESASSESIRGAMTLRQVAESTGVPLEQLIVGLRLPPAVDPDERIGRMRKRFDVSPDDVRRVVNDYRAAH